MEIILIVAAAVFAVFVMRKRAEIHEAKDAYVKSLSALKSDPTNADVKQRTLGLGRVYSNLTRDQKGNTLFDEVAMMNDINAACAAAAISPTSAPNSSQSKLSLEERLHTLTALKDKGLIDGQEYEQRRSDILKSI